MWLFFKTLVFQILEIFISYKNVIMMQYTISRYQYFWRLYTDNITECERQNQVMTYVLGVLNGSIPKPQELPGSMRDFLRTLHVTELIVPTCWDHSTSYGGTFKYICTYDIDTLEQKGCICTDENGVYNGLTYYDQACHCERNNLIISWF